ncbi:MAG TPA: hypothetical protein VFM18_11055 [Methanosarcina sp.]|nr:hypothetical protein [Methanosarcina sp.]
MTTKTRIEYTSEYKEGYLCFERGGSKSECRYLKESAAYHRWITGYLDAKEDDAEE